MEDSELDKTRTLANEKGHLLGSGTKSYLEEEEDIIQDEQVERATGV